MSDIKSYTIKPYALVLGGSSGLGLATARKLAQEGYGLWIVHRDRGADREKVAERFDEIRKINPELITQNTDALHPQKITEAIQEVLSTNPSLRLRVVVYSIAKGNVRYLVDQENASLGVTDFALTSEAMAFGLLRWVQKLDNEELLLNPASVIAFTSEGSRKAWPGYAAVGAAKAALESMVRSMALEYASKGLRCNCVQAGVTKTPSSSLIPGFEQLAKESKRRNPYGRLTLPEDVGNAVALLVKDEALWINGAVIPVDGGESIR